MVKKKKEKNHHHHHHHYHHHHGHHHLMDELLELLLGQVVQLHLQSERLLCNRLVRRVVVLNCQD